MKLNKLILTLVVAVGVATTQLAMAQSPDDSMSCHGHRHPDLSRMLTHMLNLSDTQQSQLKPIVAEVQPQLDAIHKQARESADAVLKQLNTKIRPLLTPEQQKRLDAMQTLREARPEPSSQ